MAYTNSVDSGLKTRTNTLFNIDDPGHFVKSALLPDPWSICIHPRGWIYFRNASLKVVTDHDVRDETTLELVERAAMDFPIGALAEGMEVHLCHMHMMRDDLPAHEVPSNIFNLVVNHSSCVASYQIEDVLPENVPLLNAKLLNRVRRHYWNYVWNHPSHIPTPERAIRDATDALTMFWTDNLILGNQSTMPFSKAECEELSTILRDLHGNDHSTSKTMFLAWFLREVTSFRASESYGELTIKQTTSLKTQRESSLSARTLSPVSLLLIHAVINCFFFGIPHTYWAHIKATSEYRGRLADVQHKWEKYIERLVREYSHFLLISTVLLSATVGFLSIDNITEGARLAASVSALTSLASIIIGVFSVWRHQANTSRRHSYTYMHNIQHSFLGVPGHAILLSLPPSLLVWAVVGFTFAVVAYVVQGATSPEFWDKISAWVLLAIFLVLLGIVFLALHTFSVIWTFQRRTPKKLCIPRWAGLWNKRELFKGVV